jgi:hypothetical protein
MSRYKRIIGDTLRSHTRLTQEVETRIAVTVLNRMLDFGRPEAVRAAWWSRNQGSTPFSGLRAPEHLAIMRTCQENGERMYLLESFHIDEKADTLRFELPAWQMKIMEEFRSLFDEDEAQYRYLKTMNELISKRFAGGHIN